jgi:hypothetical protein
MKLYKSISLFAVTVGLISPTLGAIAMTPQLGSSESNAQTLISIGFPPVPSGQERITGGTGGGGTRSGGDACASENGVSEVIPLIPTNQIPNTVAPNPSLYIYVPQTKAQVAEFVVMDLQGDYLYSQKFKLSGQAGIAKIKLPETNEQGKSLSLEKDKFYYWEFAIVCDQSDRASDIYAWGTFNRSQLDQSLDQALKNKSNPLEKATIYAQNRLWNETLEEMIQIRNTQPQEWQDLLKSIGIEENQVIQAPMIQLEASN